MRRSKRGFLSLLLTLALVLTMLPTTALAVDAAPVDTTPDSSATAQEETPDAPADDAGEPEETPDEPADDAGEPEETPDAPADDAGEPEETPDAPADDAGEPEETPDAPADDAGEPEETPDAPADDAGEPEDEASTEPVPAENEPVTDEAANQVTDSGPVPVENGETTMEFVVTYDDENFPTNDELFAGYVQKVLYGDVDTGVLYGVAAGNRLTGYAKKAYDLLKPIMTKIADGERASTDNIILPDDPAFSWTKADLGNIELWASSSALTEAAKKALSEKFSEAFDSQSLMDALLADCPYDMYWFNKARGGGMGFSYSIRGNANQLTVTNLSVYFVVANEYQGSRFVVDVTKATAAKTAASKADTIVTKYANKTDYEKLKGYLDEICALTDYNFDAFHDATTPYGNPWQLIWVFDNDPATKVVCEGYSKAFQYLCDLSTFSKNITCYIVTGDMASGDTVAVGEGPHMWNVVKMEDGKNYLVDATNCDGNGRPTSYSLFMKGSPTGAANRYTVSGISYLYGEDEQGRYTDADNGYLKLATSDYTVPNAIPVAITGVELEDKVFDGLDSGTVKKVTFKNTKTDAAVTLAENVYTATVKYANANAGTKNAVVTVDIADPNYTLATKTFTVSDAVINKATAQVKIMLDPNQQKAGKAIAITVGAVHTDSNYVVSQPKAVKMTAPATGIVLTRTAEDSIFFTGTYTIPQNTVVGDMSFTVRVDDSNFEEATATAVLKVLDRGATNVTLTADKTEATYGDTVTVTANAAKVDASDTDEFKGTLALYLGDEKLTETTDLSKDLTATLDKAKLTAGEKTFKAVFTSGNEFFANNTRELKVTIAKKSLEWDFSAITLNTKQGTAFSAASLQGSLALKGVLPDDKVTLTVEGLRVADVDALTKLDVSTAGPKGEVVLTADTLTISGDHAGNYQLPDPIKVVAMVNEVKTLDVPTEENAEKPAVPSNPDTKLEENEALTLKMETGISEIPEALKNNENLNTPSKIIGKLFTELQKVLTSATEVNSATYDVELMYSSDGGKTWNKATDNKYFPITVILPYPEGTTSGYTFRVAHMFTSGDKAGTVETPSVTNTATGLKFTVTSLSPISVAWTEPTYSGGGGGGGGNYSGDVWEKIEKKIEEADKGDRIEAKVYDDNMPVSTMQALYDDGGITLVIKYNDGEIIIPAGKALNPKTEAGRIYYPLSYLAELYKGAKVPSNAGNPETGGTWVITAPVFTDPAPTPATPEPAPAPEAVEPAPEPETPVEIPTATAPVTQPEAPAKESSKVGTIVALLALMAAAAAGAWLLWKKRDDDGLYTK